MMTALLENFISFYHQAYCAAVWSSRHNILHLRVSPSMLLDTGPVTCIRCIKRVPCDHHPR